MLIAEKELIGQTEDGAITKLIYTNTQALKKKKTPLRGFTTAQERIFCTRHIIIGREE
jgi:hypothetical protein